jgi:hypothetical protein
VIFDNAVVLPAHGPPVTHILLNENSLDSGCCIRFSVVSFLSSYFFHLNYLFSQGPADESSSPSLAK